MTHQILRLAVATTLAAVMAVPVSAAEPKDKKLSATWEVSQGGQVVATEKFKLVVKPDGRWYASAKLKPVKGRKKDLPYISVLWRGGDGQLIKYIREEDKRLGVGVKVFRHGEGLKVVGINANKQVDDIPGGGHRVWDPVMWSSLWDWLPRVKADEVAVTVPVLHVDKRSVGQASMNRLETITLWRKGAPMTITPWRVDGTGVAGLTVYLDSKNRMIGARGGERALLLEGWSWEAPPEPPPQPDAEADAGTTGTTTGGGADAGPTGETP